MLILSISMNIHVVNHYRIHSIDNTITNKLYYTMTKMFWPCLYTGLTTIVAFSSLLFSNIKPIIDFGFIMVFALLFIFLSSFTILPLLISFFPKIKKDKIKKFFILDLFYNISIRNTYIIFSTHNHTSCVPLPHGHPLVTSPVSPPVQSQFFNFDWTVRR